MSAVLVDSEYDIALLARLPVVKPEYMNGAVSGVQYSALGRHHARMSGDAFTQPGSSWGP